MRDYKRDPNELWVSDDEGRLLVHEAELDDYRTTKFMEELGLVRRSAVTVEHH